MTAIDWATLTAGATAAEEARLIPEGKHKARVLSVIAGESKNSGADMLVIQLEVGDAKIKSYLPFPQDHHSPQYQSMFVQRLACLGFDASKAAEVGVATPQQLAGYLTMRGVECMVTIKHEDYLGRKRSTVTGYGMVKS